MMVNDHRTHKKIFQGFRLTNHAMTRYLERKNIKSCKYWIAIISARSPKKIITCYKHDPCCVKKCAHRIEFQYRKNDTVTNKHNSIKYNSPRCTHHRWKTSKPVCSHKNVDDTGKKKNNDWTVVTNKRTRKRTIKYAVIKHDK